MDKRALINSKIIKFPKNDRTNKNFPAQPKSNLQSLSSNTVNEKQRFKKHLRENRRWVSLNKQQELWILCPLYGHHIEWLCTLSFGYLKCCRGQGMLVQKKTAMVCFSLCYTRKKIGLIYQYILFKFDLLNNQITRTRFLSERSPSSGANSHAQISRAINLFVLV